MDDIQNNWPEMQLTPIGRVSSSIKKPFLTAGESGIALEERIEKIRENHEKVKAGTSELIIFSKWTALLDGIEDFSHILVLYWPHLVEPGRRELQKVHPMGRKDLPLQGIFATCSPARPNPVLVSAVPLLGRNGNVLNVKGLDAVDGSPIIDIKPYVQPFYKADDRKIPEWMKKIHRDLEIDLS